MNLFGSDKIVPEKTEDLILPRKDLTKVFQISKIKKIRNTKLKFFKSEILVNQNDNKLICKEINLFYEKAQTNEMIISIPKNDNSLFKSIKRTPEKKLINIFDKKEKSKKIKKFMNESSSKEIKKRKSISLIKPVLVEDDFTDENKKSEKPVNPLKTNIQNNFKFNSIFNNFIFNDFEKITKSFNNNFMNPFNFTQNYPLKNKFLFDYKPFSIKEDFLKDNGQKFQYIPNNIIINKYPENKTDNVKKKDKFNISNVSFINSNAQDMSFEKDKNIQKENVYKKKGRKSKNLKDLNLQSKHTKFSPDNMMRKIKNKIIESSRLLTNKILAEEIYKMKDKFQFPYIEFKKIKGSFGQELNIKFNLWFYQIKIKDIFSMEISTKYSSLEKNSNKELIEYIFSNNNINYFPKTKSLLDMPFHQYYHDIFLGENKSWMICFEISPENNKYEINYLLNSLEEEDKNNNMNKIYIEKMNKLAHNYEDFFLYKKMRSVGLGEKRNEFIKSFMSKTFKVDYSKYFEQVEQIKNYYNNRNKGLELNLLNLSKKETNATNDEDNKDKNKNDGVLKGIIININNENNEQFLKRKRNLEKK